MEQTLGRTDNGLNYLIKCYISHGRIADKAAVHIGGIQLLLKEAIKLLRE